MQYMQMHNWPNVVDLRSNEVSQIVYFPFLLSSNVIPVYRIISITVFELTRSPQHVPHPELDLLTPLGHSRSALVAGGVHVTQTVVVYVMFF